MEWSQLYSPRRTTDTPNSASKDIRTAYQRDFDRLIFSSAFRRLQDKTQVFPLPGSTFVHNRLTHSLEVASVGRSLGNMVGNYVADANKNHFNEDNERFYRTDLANIIAAACLAHDIGNPAFGHSGEDAISNYFLSNARTSIEGKELRYYFSDWEWSDLTHFEGNANALRVLAQSFPGKSKGGLGLTYTSLASIFKYPCNSTQTDKGFKHRKKYSYFQSEEDIFHDVIEAFSFEPDGNAEGVFRRHPFVYLVEAADDICYRIIDLEDAHRLGIVSKQTISDLLWSLIEQLDSNVAERMSKTYNLLSDDNEAVSYLRAKSIGLLIQKSYQLFISNKKNILDCTYNSTLLDDIESLAPALKAIESISIDKIYNHSTVIEIELAGYNVMKELLSIYIPAVLKAQLSAFDKQVLKLIPNQFKNDFKASSPYQKVMHILDHISAMTDIYATDQYRKIKGIEIPKHA